jgi:hypothetical protein
MYLLIFCLNGLLWLEWYDSNQSWCFVIVGIVWATWVARLELKQDVTNDTDDAYGKWGIITKPSITVILILIEFCWQFRLLDYSR